MGGMINASTGQWGVHFFCYMPNQYLSSVVSCYVDSLFGGGELTDENLRREKGAVRAEMLATQRRSVRRNSMLVNKTLFNAYISSEAAVQSLGNIDLSVIKQLHAELFRPGNLEVYFAGDVNCDINQLRRAIEPIVGRQISANNNLLIDAKIKDFGQLPYCISTATNQPEQLVYYSWLLGI